MFVTEVAPLDNKRRRVYIDGRYAFPLYLSELRRFNIAEGAEVSEILYNSINSVIHRRIRERSLFLLDSMPRTERDIRKVLLRANYTEESISPVIDELKACRYIDDYDYAVNYAAMLRDNKGRGRKYIEQRLYEKGISGEIVSSVMETVSEDESGLIIKALEKKGYKVEELPSLDNRNRQKLYRYLLGRGFSAGDICRYFSVFSD